ncbi:MAG: PilZ domain-containing protein [Myxococcota bacterium]|nr:PilZ domain-containing protein [Myxococcota bacterium]
MQGTSYEGRTNNVSRGGLCAVMADPITIGADIGVDLRLVFAEQHHSDALRLPARVAWCTAVDEAFQIGIAFKPLDAELGKFLTTFLRYLDDGCPAKPEKRASTVDERFG